MIVGKALYLDTLVPYVVQYTHIYKYNSLVCVNAHRVRCISAYRDALALAVSIHNVDN